MAQHPCQHPLSRRHVLGQILAGTGAPLLPLCQSPARAAGSEQTDRNKTAEIHLHITRQKITLDGKTGFACLVNNSLPGPVLRFREGQEAVIHVHNHLEEPTSVHWHGIRLPAAQDGVPGLSFAGIPPGTCFTYRFPIIQSGTYWYHSHSPGQEPAGLYGALIIEPKEDLLPPVTRDYTLLLSEWTDVAPEEIMSNLKMQDDYYTFRQRSLASLPQEARKQGGLEAALANRLRWSRMRMAATDISDVSGVIYSYLLNGRPNGSTTNRADTPWTGQFRPGETIRLRLINGASMTLFDLRIPGLSFRVVEADGNPVEPVEVEEFRIGVGETYVIDVTFPEEKSYQIFVQSEDRTGYALGLLSPFHMAEITLPVPHPLMDERPVRTMVDMGMNMDMMTGGYRAGMGQKSGTMTPMAMSSMAGMAKSPPRFSYALGAEIDDPGLPPLSVENQMVAQNPVDRTSSPGDGLEQNGRRVLSYADLRALCPSADKRLPSREIILHVTGNMERYIWGFNGRKFSESGPIILRRNERVRFTLINDTMMEHPLHLHGLWSELENGQGEARPVKHTIISQPGSVMRFLVTADIPGDWAYHCHLAYHMDTGMFRTVRVL